jgi:chorismate dehydratase
LAQKIRVGAVSYLNTKPLIYGFEQGRMQDEVELVIDYPANIAGLLQNDETAVGLVPVAVLGSLKEYHIVSDYCISCDGEVVSVCLFSDVPVEQIETILLDYQSRTSVALLKILLKEHWNISPRLVMAEENYEKDISGTTAGLVIGDRAFRQRQSSKYIFDLGVAWKEMTGLPFVFATWVSNKPLDSGFMERFDSSIKIGLDHLDDIVRQTPYPFFDLHEYYTRHIEYQLTAEKREALQLFLSKMHNAEFPEVKMC